MATAASTLVIKTEGVTESYSDIGKLLGPLQGINTMLYQLNKALGIQNKQSIASGKSLEKLGKEGNKTAQSQLELQKQLRATAKEATKAAKEQVEHAKSASEALKGLNVKAGFDLALKAGKELVKVSKEVYKFASGCLDKYYEQANITKQQQTTLNYIKAVYTSIQVMVGKIIAQHLDTHMKNVADPVHTIGANIRGIATSIVTAVEWAKVAKEVVGAVGQALWQVIWLPIKAINTTIASILNAASYIPGISAETAKYMRETAEWAKNTADFFNHDYKENEKAISDAHKEGEQIRALINEAFSDKNIATTLAAIQKKQAAQAQADKQERQAQQKVQLTAEQQHQLNLKHIADELAAKLAALDEIAGDEQIKAGLRSQLLTQSLEAEKAEKLRYAQETNDQLYIMNTQLRAAEDAANKAAAEARRIEAQKQLAEAQAIEQKWIDIADGIRNNLSKGALKELTGAAENLFDQMISGEEMTREGAYEMMSSMAKNIAKVGFQNLLSLAGELIMSSATSASKVPVIGPALAAAAMATFGGLTAALMAKYKPKQAQVQYENGGYISAGLVKGGVANKDSVMAALMPGERVLSKKEAEEYDEGYVGSTIQNITINVSGQFNTPQQITQMVRQTIIPELRKATRAGLSIGA